MTEEFYEEFRLRMGLLYREVAKELEEKKNKKKTEKKKKKKK